MNKQTFLYMLGGVIAAILLVTGAVPWINSARALFYEPVTCTVLSSQVLSRESAPDAHRLSHEQTVFRAAVSYEYSWEGTWQVGDRYDFQVGYSSISPARRKAIAALAGTQTRC